MEYKTEYNLDELDEQELQNLLGRVEVRKYSLEKFASQIQDRLEEEQPFGFSHCGLCGEELTNDLDRDTGICQACASI